MAQVKGGKTIYGATVGILMLETHFPRVEGDIGNALTWPFPVRYRVVKGASPDAVVRKRGEGLLEPFIEAGRDLIDEGVDGITTTCGFLSLFQEELAAALDVPVASSSLMQYAMIQATLPPVKRVGILTISAEMLTSDHLKAAGVPLDAPMAGTEAGQAFCPPILADEPEMDFEAACQEVVEAGLALCRSNRDLGAILLECTNMVPFAPQLRAATGLPIYSIYSFVQWFQSGLLPRRFPAPWITDSRV